MSISEKRAAFGAGQKTRGGGKRGGQASADEDEGRLYIDPDPELRMQNVELRTE